MVVDLFDTTEGHDVLKASAPDVFEALMAAKVDEDDVQEVLLSSVSIGGQGDDGTVDSACNSTVSGDAYAMKIEGRCKKLGIDKYIKKEPPSSPFSVR